MAVSDKTLTLSLMSITLILVMFVFIFVFYDQNYKYSLVCNGDSFAPPQEQYWYIEDGLIKSGNLIYKPKSGEICVVVTIRDN